MLLSEILLPNEYRSDFSASDISFTHISFDTRRRKEEDIFVALPGRHADPLLHLARESRPPVAVILENGTELAASLRQIPHFYVENPHATLAHLFSRLSGSPEKALTICGVTGTAGKSSTAELLYRILRENGFHTGLIGSIHCLADNEVLPLPREAEALTTPEADVLYPLLREMRDRGVTHVVMEVSSQALSLERCAPIPFALALFTNLSPEHLDFHGDMEHYFQAKEKLFYAARRSVVNGDSSYGQRLFRALGSRCVRVSIDREAEYTALSPSIGESVAYTLHTGGIALPIRFPMAGRFSVYNSLLAMAGAMELSVSPLVAARALAEARMIFGRMEKLDLSAYHIPFDVMIDYAHTPASLESLLESVRGFTEGRLLLLFGCGGDRDPGKRQKMGEIAEKYADYICITADNSRGESTEGIINEIKSGLTGKKPVFVCPDRREAILHILNEGRAGDMILLVGKGHETYEIRKDGRSFFDEREVVKDGLILRKEANNE